MSPRPSGHRERSYRKLTRKDLRELRALGIQEHKEFFGRNPHLAKSYQRALIAVCVCQGAASHFLNPSIGVKDYDVWHFYADNPRVQFPYRAHERSMYNGKRVDFLKRAIPRRIVNDSGNPGEAVVSYLLERDTGSKKKLLIKAVIGLHPDTIFGKVLWKGTL